MTRFLFLAATAITIAGCHDSITPGTDPANVAAGANITNVDANAMPAGANVTDIPADDGDAPADIETNAR